MLTWFTSRKKIKNEALALYTAAVNAARQPVFYEELSVPDTMDGRFDMICLHVSLLVDAITPEDTEKPNALGQAVFDVMFKDMDLNIREMGVGDLGVPRHIKKMMRALKGRFMAYRTALAAEDMSVLKEALKRNLYGTLETVEDKTLTDMAHYVRELAASLRAKGEATLLLSPKTAFILEGIEEDIDAA